MVDWNDLRVFLTAVRAGSYTGAAAQLGMNRTTVGRRVAALEAALGTALFREAPDGYGPTRSGSLLLASAARIEAEMAVLDAALGRREADPAPLRIASSAGIAAEFLPEFAAFAGRHPEVPTELTGALDPIAAVTERRADLALALVRAVPRRLAGVEVGAVTQAPYARAGSEETTWLGWGAEIEIALPRHWTAPNLAERATARFNGFPALKAAVLAGAGCAWLPCCLAEGLVRLDEPDPRYETRLWLLHRADTPPGAGAEALVRYLASALAERLR